MGSNLIDLLMGLCRGAFFRHGGGARKQPIDQRAPNGQISFEPGFGAYQGLAQEMKVPLSRFFRLFLQFWGFKGDVKTRAKTPVRTLVSQRSVTPFPKNLLRLFFCALKIIFIFWGYFQRPSKKTLQSKHKNNLARLFLFFEVIFCLARLFLKNNLKRFLGFYDIDMVNLRCCTPPPPPKRTEAAATVPVF